MDNPLFHWSKFMGHIMSPYDFNPSGYNPLRPFLETLFDFEILRQSKNSRLFLCATEVSSGKLKIFHDDELNLEALLASACVPTLFQAIEINGKHYWDGGFIGNPAIYPLIYHCDSPDILVIQIRRVHDETVPKTVNEIQNRLGEITQNACLTREMRAIAFVTNLIDEGKTMPGALKRLNMHLIRDDVFFGNLERETGFVLDSDLIDYLYKAGYAQGKAWLEDHFDDVGVRSSADLEKDYV
jgi:NTE family protein